jgi:hypothetical protein
VPSEPITANKLDINEVLRAVTEAHAKEVKQMGTLTEDDIPELQAKWLRSCQDIMNGVLEELPPMCGVNHHIPLIDENKRYHYHLPRCPDSIRENSPFYVDLCSLGSQGSWVARSISQLAT